MAWAKNGTPDTLASASDELSIADLTENKFNMLMSHEIYSGVAQGDLNFNNDKAGNDYATRSSKNGAADSTETSANRLIYMADNASGTADFEIGYLFDIASEEKLIIGFFNNQNTAGAGNAPSRREMVGKYDETASRITRIDIDNVGAGDFDTGSNLSVLGSEITPAAAIPFAENVQAGSRAEITDTRKMYNYVVPSITLEDDFSSDNWTDSDSTNIGVSGGVLNWSMFRNMSNDASSRDLGSVASDKWVLRFKVTQGSSIGSTQAGNGFHFGISDSDNSVAQNASQDFVGMSYYYDNQSSYKAQDSDGAIVPEVWQGDSSQNFNITANDVFYFEIIKNGSSYTVEGFTNSDYSTGSLGKITGTTTATGLRYLKIMNDLPAQGSIPTSTNPFNGTIDDVKFYDGFTQTTSFWQEIGA